MAGAGEMQAGRARPGKSLAEMLDGATGDYGVSGDAMRWSPDLVEESEGGAARELPGMDVAAGLGSLIGLDASGVRRLVSGALYTLTTAATDVVSELRQLTRGAAATEPDQQGAEQGGEAAEG